MNVITPESDIQDIKKHSVFLSGTMGKIDGKPWRQSVIERYEGVDNKWSIIDPSVDDWDNKIGEQSLTNPKYVNQLAWERNMILNADVIFMAFTKDSVGIGSLLEFALVYMARDNIIMFIEDGYERQAPLTFFCNERGIQVNNSLNKAINSLNFYVIQSRI